MHKLYEICYVSKIFRKLLLCCVKKTDVAGYYFRGTIFQKILFTLGEYSWALMCLSFNSTSGYVQLWFNFVLSLNFLVFRYDNEFETKENAN